MKNCFAFTFAAVLLFTGSTQLFSAEPAASGTNAPSADGKATAGSTQADLEDLIGRINEKLKTDKNTAADLALNLVEFDALIAKHKDAGPDVLSSVLGMKAKLYLQVLDDPANALETFKKIKSDYPTAKANQNIDEVITQLQQAVDRKKAAVGLIVGAKFPDFSETDVEGKPLSISQFKGKVVLVDFWATWCGPCVTKLPEIQAAYNKFHEKGFEIVGISLDEEKEKLQAFTKQKNMPWPEFFDGKRWENKLALKYGVDATPTGYLLNREGKIIAKLSIDEDVGVEVAKAMEN